MPDPIKVLNPIASPLAVMRSSLLGSLIQVLRTNLARKASRVRVFEIGRVYRRDASVADGPTQVAGIDQIDAPGRAGFGSNHIEQWGEKARAVDFFDVKGDLEALFAAQDGRVSSPPGTRRCILVAARAIEIDGRAVGVVGELHPRWRQSYELPSAPVLFEIDLAAC